MSPHHPPMKTPAEEASKCPRCDSPNTKFCYYNNYSLTQPRHLCKTCRRYWTKGGALRNVPIGGGCRKTKKIKSSSTGHYSTNHFSSSAGFGLESSLNMGVNNYVEINNNSVTSSIDQDMHWNMQQQRLATLFGNGNYQATNCTDADGVTEEQRQNLTPILFQNQDISRKEAGGGDVATERFFGKSYTNQSAGGGVHEYMQHHNPYPAMPYNLAQTDLPQFHHLPRLCDLEI